MYFDVQWVQEGASPTLLSTSNLSSKDPKVQQSNKVPCSWVNTILLSSPWDTLFPLHGRWNYENGLFQGRVEWPDSIQNIWEFLCLLWSNVWGYLRCGARHLSWDEEMRQRKNKPFMEQSSIPQWRSTSLTSTTTKAYGVKKTIFSQQLFPWRVPLNIVKLCEHCNRTHLGECR